VTRVKDAADSELEERGVGSSKAGTLEVFSERGWPCTLIRSGFSLVGSTTQPCWRPHRSSTCPGFLPTFWAILFTVSFWHKDKAVSDRRTRSPFFETVVMCLLFVLCRYFRSRTQGGDSVAAALWLGAAWLRKKKGKFRA
jgi:hypothetical protein